VTHSPEPGGLAASHKPGPNPAAEAGAALATIAALRIGLATFGSCRTLKLFNPRFAELLGMPDGLLHHGLAFVDLLRQLGHRDEFRSTDGENFLAAQLAMDRSRASCQRQRRTNGQVIDIASDPLPTGGWTVTLTEITAQAEAEADSHRRVMQAEDEISRRAIEMDMMLANLRHGIILFGADRRVIAANTFASQLLDFPPGMLSPGRSLAELVTYLVEHGDLAEDPDGREFARSRLAADRSKPDVYRRRVRGDRVLEIRSYPAQDGAFVVSYSDVTEAQAAEAELLRAKSAAEAANQAKSRFLATMSHELRTPLNAVIGFSDAIQREAGGNPDPDQIGDFAREINDAGRHLLTLINNILDVARIDAGRFDLSADRIDLHRLVQTCIRQNDSAARAAEVALSADIPPEMPVLVADERRLQQVMNHLLSNAIKFTEAGGSVNIGAEMDGNGNCLLHIADTGIGIPEADIERVFEPFIQVDGSLSRRFQGAGLGLYVSRALVEAQGGRLRLRSEVGVGTTAEVRLPVQRPVGAGIDHDESLREPT